MKIVKSSIKEQAYQILKEKILKQEIKLGEQLNPKKIAEENNVSIMPIRDALLRLVNQGLVINKPRVGFFVKEFTEKEIKEIIEVREMYELFCITRHFDNIDRTKLKTIRDEVNKCTENLNREKFDEIDIDLHYTIIKSSENDFLIKNYNKIKDLLVLVQHLNLERIKEAHTEHKIIVNHILDGNKNKSREALKIHFNQVKLSVLDCSKDVFKEAN